MRLGDLDALKKAYYNAIAESSIGEVSIGNLIDNAPTIDTDEIYKKGYHTGFFATHDAPPTVEPCYQTTSCLDCKNYDKENYYCPRFCEVIREATKEIKRQGEWKPKHVTFGSCFLQGFECDCGRVVMQRENFCPNCGADMRCGESNE